MIDHKYWHPFKKYGKAMKNGKGGFFIHYPPFLSFRIFRVPL